jgi:hypothetical protein
MPLATAGHLSVSDLNLRGPFAMSDDPKKGSKIGGELATRRRIRSIERKAVRKLGKAEAPTSGAECSFCGRLETEVPPLIEGDGTARICPECVRQIAERLQRPGGD